MLEKIASERLQSPSSRIDESGVAPSPSVVGSSAAEAEDSEREILRAQVSILQEQVERWKAKAGYQDGEGEEGEGERPPAYA
jgi:hypothetical protein